MPCVRSIRGRPCGRACRQGLELSSRKECTKLGGCYASAARREQTYLSLAGIDRANLRAVLNGRRRPSPAMLARLEKVLREP